MKKSAKPRVRARVSKQPPIDAQAMIVTVDGMITKALEPVWWRCSELRDALTASDRTWLARLDELRLRVAAREDKRIEILMNGAALLQSELSTARQNVLTLEKGIRERDEWIDKLTAAQPPTRAELIQRLRDKMREHKQSATGPADAHEFQQRAGAISAAILNTPFPQRE